MDQELLTIQETAGRLRIGRTLVYRLISSGDLPVVRLGRAVRIPVRAVDDLVQHLLGGGTLEGVK